MSVQSLEGSSSLLYVFFVLLLMFLLLLLLLFFPLDFSEFQIILYVFGFFSNLDCQNPVTRQVALMQIY